MALTYLHNLHLPRSPETTHQKQHYSVFKASFKSQSCLVENYVSKIKYRQTDVATWVLSLIICRCKVLSVDDEMDADFAHLTHGNLARWKRGKHCSFVRQGGHYGSAWQGAAWMKRWFYQSDGSDLVAKQICFTARMPMLFDAALRFAIFVWLRLLYKYPHFIFSVLLQV